MLSFRPRSSGGDASDSDTDSEIRDISASFASDKPKKVAPKHCEGTLSELFQDKDLSVNLVIMTFIWTITSFAYYLGKFQIKTVAGDIYINSLTSSVADIVSRPCGLLLYRCMPTQRVIVAFFIIALIGSSPVIFSEYASPEYKEYVVPGCLLILNFGITGNFGNLYIGHLDLFPNVFSGTTMGICNVVARLCTVFAPIVAEIKQPVPEITLTSLCIIAIILALFVRNKSNTFY